MRLTLAIALCGIATGAFADPIEGTWRTRADDNGHFGHVVIAPCGPAFCGTLQQAFNANGAETASPNIGRQIVWDMQARDGGAYGGGKIWSPDRDKTYAGKMTLSGDALAVSGCVLGICRDGGTWQRVK